MIACASFPFLQTPMFLARFRSVFFRAVCGGALGLLLGLALGTVSWADSDNYRAAFEDLREGHTDLARHLVDRGPDATLNEVLRGLLMAQPGTNASFEDMKAFINDHPEDPGLPGILRIAEQKIPAPTSLGDVIAWFRDHPPLTLVGFYRFVDALDQTGASEEAARLVRARWVEGDFRSEEQAAFASRFHGLLRLEDHWARLDHLVWDNDVTEARAFFPFVTPEERALAEVRLALHAASSSASPSGAAMSSVATTPRGAKASAKHAKTSRQCLPSGHKLKPPRHTAKAAKARAAHTHKAARAPARPAVTDPDDLCQRVEASLQGDPGLLFERLRWYRVHHRDDDAVRVLLDAPSDLGRPETWWDERSVLIRRMLARHDAKLAYRLAEGNGLPSGAGGRAEAEFLAGWIALQFLNAPQQASEHFKTLTSEATTPFSRARAAYWTGRVQEALGDRDAARSAYEEAAILSFTFYGQLAATRLSPAPVLRAPAEPEIPSSVRQAFSDRYPVQAFVRLRRVGQDDLAERFFRAIVNVDQRRVSFVLLADLARRTGRPDLAIAAVKAAHKKNMVVTEGAFPMLDVSVPDSRPEPALVNALVRQESLFSPVAKSPVGARGLMQLMPATARELAKKLDVRYSESRLTSDPAYNVRFGSAYLQHVLERFDGTYPLGIASYNAGPGRVREWLDTYGDPRQSRLDFVDWIELIPVHETRAYVQHVLENLQVYRAQLAGGQAPLKIQEDLR